MNLLSFRSFTTELSKIAAEIMDPDMRAMEAEKKGKPYLQGGQLASGTEAETNFQPKLAFRSLGATNMSNIANSRGRRINPEHASAYEKVRDYGMAGLTGAMTGVGALGLGHALIKNDPGSRGGSGGAFRAAAGIGAGLRIGDRMFRNHQRKHQEEAMAKAASSLKTAMLGDQSFTPGRSLQASGQTHRFEGSVIHKGNAGPAAGLIGQKGRIS